MEVNVTSSIGINAPPAYQTSNVASVDYNSFLKLLIAQMKNQDPTKPNDPTQYIAQLASFSSVEQSIQTNAKLDSLLASSALNQAATAVGRTITSADGLTSGRIVSVRIDATGPIAVIEGGRTIPFLTGVALS